MFKLRRIAVLVTVAALFAAVLAVATDFDPAIALQQRVAIRGTQERGVPGRNATLVSNPVKLSKPGTIDSVEGGRAGFWIEGARRMSFDSPGDAVGTTLPAGTYRAYPNLPRDANTASVTVNVVLQP